MSTTYAATCHRCHGQIRTGTPSGMSVCPHCDQPMNAGSLAPAYRQEPRRYSIGGPIGKDGEKCEIRDLRPR